MATQCNDIETLLPTYLDGELGPHDQLSVDHHVADCGTCRERVRAEVAYLARVRELIAPPPPPEELRARVREALDREDGEARAARRRSRRTWALPSAAGLAAAAALTLLITSELRSPSSADAAGDHASASHRSGPAFAVDGPLRVSNGQDVSWRQARFDARLGERVYQIDVENASCRNIDLSKYDRRIGQLWVAQGKVNTVIYSWGATCFAFASDLELEQLVRVVRSILVDLARR